MAFLEKYHGYDIVMSNIGKNALNCSGKIVMGYSIEFAVRKARGKIFKLKFHVSDLTLIQYKKSVEEAQSILREKGIQRVHELIDSLQLEKGKPCEDYWINFD